MRKTKQLNMADQSDKRGDDMTNNELLLAMSEMMDHKFKSELRPLKNDLQTVKEEVQTVKEKVQAVEERVQAVEERVQAVEERVQAVDEKVQAVEEKVQAVEGEVRSVKADLRSVKNEVHHTRLYQENVILPRLETIESCYTDTYDRYKKYADKMEEAFTDIELLKKVVTEHSEKLQKIS